MAFLRKLKEFLLDALFPRLCVSCRNYIDHDRFSTVCDRCFETLEPHSTLFCAVCKARLPLNKKICHRDSPFLLAAAGDYANPVLRGLLHSFKYSFAFEAFSPLIEFLTTYLKRLDLTFSDFVVIPVPLHTTRERARGFNQSVLLGKFIADYLRLPYFSQGLLRIHNTTPQVGLRDRKARETNIVDAFRLNLPLHEIENKNIILVDDVFTSGATLREAARVLKSNGAKGIVAFVLVKA